MNKLIIFALIACSVVFATGVDKNTFSNYQQIVTKKWDAELVIDFDDQQIRGTQTIDLEALDGEVDTVDLDIWGQDILGVFDTNFNALIYYINHPSDNQGQQLRIQLNSVLNKGEQVTLYITFHTQEKNANAISWLTKDQTKYKNQPYMFTQCEPIYCRSIVPLQDTPSVKSTYTAKITLKKGINVFLSAEQTDSGDDGEDYWWFQWEQKNVIPSYLFSIVAGDVAARQIQQSNTYVISEPGDLDEYSQILDNLPNMLASLENIVDKQLNPYTWGEYKIVILPPSFPFGGMENPLLTFASPSIMAKDKSGVGVAVHEIAHSWTGNTVTCANWRNMWMNEGFTVFLERKAYIDLYDLEYWELEVLNGNSSLLTDIQTFGETSSYSSLYPNTDGENPDDSFSTIPYEKGFQYLHYLEGLFKSAADFQDVINSWIKEQTWKSIDYTDFIQHIHGWLETHQDKYDGEDIAHIEGALNVEGWVTNPGQVPTPLDVTSKIADEARQLADDWAQHDGEIPAQYNDFNTWPANGKYVFLEQLNTYGQDLKTVVTEAIDGEYDLTNAENYEVKWRWLRTAIYSGLWQEQAVSDAIEQFLATNGRMKLIRPLFVALKNVNQLQKAIDIYQKNKDFYHPIARAQIERDLGIQKDIDEAEVSLLKELLLRVKY